jgi:MFS family permease
MFLLVFGIQEGETYDWGAISGFLSVPLLIAVGVAVLAVFLFWQARNRQEPLVPLGLFRDRNFSISNAAITTVGFSITAMAFPFMLYAQVVRGMSPTESALLLVPMALVSAGLAPVAGRLTDRLHPRYITTFGLAATSGSLFWLSAVTTPESRVWQLLLPMALMGLGSPFMWAPLSATATRNLPMRSAGAGAGIYNTTRQVGAVLGSAAIAALIDSRLAVNLPGMPHDASPQAAGHALPPQVADGFATAMSQALLLPAAVLLVGLVAVLLYQRPSHHTAPRSPEPVVAEV